MAGYKGHIAGATVAGGLYVGLLAFIPATVMLTSSSGLLSDWQFLAVLFVVAILFGLWPDVDTNSAGQNIFFGLAFIVDILLLLTGRFEAAAYLGLLAMTPIIGKHRGWTHSIVAMVLVPLPILILPYLYDQSKLQIGMMFYGAAVAGYFSHLFLDGRIWHKFRIKT